MTKFSMEKTRLIEEFGRTHGWCRSDFDLLEGLYNEVFGTNLKSRCPACARGRYVDSLKNWYKLSLKYFEKHGLVMDNEFGIPYGLTTRTMNAEQREQYDSLSRSEKIRYNKVSRGEGDAL